MRPDDVVPFTVKAVTAKIDLLHLGGRDLTAGRIFAAIQSASDRQAFGGRRLGNEIDDGLVISQRFAAPIRRDEGKQAVLDLVPLARARRKMTDRNGQARVIRESLEFDFPQPQAPAIAAAGIRGDQDRGCVRIETFPFMTPPAPDRRHRKRARVMVGADIDKAGVAPDVVNAKRIGSWHLGRGKVSARAPASGVWRAAIGARR